MGGDSTTAKEDKKKLYVRLPEKIVDEQQIKDLHSCITKVYLPRQKSRRWCTIEFDPKYTVDSVIKELKQVRVKGKKIYVNFLKRKPKPIIVS